MSMLCDKWLTDFPIIQQLIEECFLLNPDVQRPSETLQWLSFAEVEQCDYRSLTSDTMILVAGGTLRRPLDVGSALLISDSGMISAPVVCGLFHKRRTIVCVPVLQRLKTIEPPPLQG